jgi:hypothetical protein
MGIRRHDGSRIDPAEMTVGAGIIGTDAAMGCADDAKTGTSVMSSSIAASLTVGCFSISLDSVRSMAAS